jgi:signal transduction histidine kinase
VTSTVPRWAAITIYVGAGLFGLLNLTLSSLSIGSLALNHLNLGLLRAIALGLTPDAGALVAGTLWVACAGHLRTWGRNVSLGLVGGSVVGNAADILAAAGLVDARFLVPLAVTLGVAAPVLALVMGHLVLLVQAARSAEVDRDATPPTAKRDGVTRRRPPVTRDDRPDPPPAAARPVTVANAVTETTEQRRRRLAAERAKRYRDNQKNDAAADAAA